MKRKIFIFCVIFLCVFLCFLGYKFFITGNTKNIESTVQADEYILNIKNYNIEARVTVWSNKNSNTYNLRQYKKDGYQKQEIISDNMDQGIIIENKGNELVVKNTKIGLEKVFEDFEEITSNSLGLDSFIEDYKQTEEKKVTEDEKYYMLFADVKKSRNIYIKTKILYINKQNGEIEKIEVKDVNNNRIMLIEYISLEIL